MAFEAEAYEIASFFERIVRERDLSLLVSFIMGLASAASRTDKENPDLKKTLKKMTLGERLIFINPLAQTMIVVKGDSLQDLGLMKDGQPPTLKASIDAMSCVKIVEGDGGSECVICLEQFETDGVAKEMPCKHRFQDEKNSEIRWSRPKLKTTAPTHIEQ